MLDSLRSTVGQTIEATLAIVGIRVGTEEPAHTSERLTERVELRRYRPRIAAETVVAADEESARREGFRRLAGYIFGRNDGADSIAMTAPVAQSVAATDIGEQWTVRFFMPGKRTLGSLPRPTDDRVRLAELPAATFAVLRFSGDRSARAVASHTAELQNVLREYGFTAVAEPAAWFYDPPWTVPFRRRNEIAVPIEA